MGQPQNAPPPPLPAASVKDAARACGFPLVGLAPAEALDEGPLRRWLAAGHAADMDWMAAKVEQRLDPRKVLPGAATVVALAIPHGARAGEDSTIARYARGRDYHYAHRDRLKTLRKRLLTLAPGLETYACVDTGLAMEKPWAERAGLGWIGKNGCLITPSHGSFVTLSVMFLDRAVDAYDQPHDERCGTCALCLPACPTGAFPSPGVVDARRCLSYQTIENRGLVPLGLRPKLRGHTFGCDVCQDVCPHNHAVPSAGDPRLDTRPIGTMSPAALAALSEAEYAKLAPGSALARAQYDGLRRNAIFALGLAGARREHALLERLSGDPSPLVAEAARYMLGRLAPAPR